MGGEEPTVLFGMPSAHTMTMHRHAACQLTIMPGDEADAAIIWRQDDGESKTVRVRGAHVFYIGKDIAHSIGWHTCGLMIHLYLPDSFVRRYTTEFFWREVTIAKCSELLRRDVFLLHLIGAIADLCLHPREEDVRYLEGMGAVLASHLLRAATSRSQTPGRRGLLPLQLRRVTEHIEAHFQETLKVNSLAELVGMNAGYFAHRFKASTGMSPYRYLLTVRIRYAQSLLREGKMSVADVAAAAGFFDQSHLGKCLKRFCKGERKTISQDCP
jgi:AraC family transcriptional regulator